MSMRELIEEHIHSSGHLAKKHVHPKLMKMFEVAGLGAVFTRADGQYLWTSDGTRYLDFLGGGGVYLLGRNHPKVNAAIKDVVEMDLPNLCVVNASILGGLLAEKLIEKTEVDTYTKVLFANSGTEATDMAIRFARFLTGRRRFLYLEGAFHGRTYASVSVCGSSALREGMEPLMPTTTPIPPNDIAALRRELSRGDVAGFLFEPVQGMTLNVMDPEYLREAETLCRRYGTLMLADEVQTGLGRTGSWYASLDAGIRPDLLWVSKILSGGQAPVSALLMSEDAYQQIFAKFKAGPIYFSTFAENNVSMAAAIATIDAIDECKGPRRARELGELFRKGVMKLAETYDVIDHVRGKGLMQAIFFKNTDSNIGLRLQQGLLGAADKGAFGAAINVDMAVKHQILCQLPGPDMNAIKVLPPVTTSEEDIQYFLDALDDILGAYYKTTGGAVRSISQGFVKDALKTVKSAVPGGLFSSILPKAGDAVAHAVTNANAGSAGSVVNSEKKNSSDGHSARGALSGPGKKPPGIYGLEDYSSTLVDNCDAIVVGSGPGGAVAAHTLAERGMDVVVLEAGPWVKPQEFSRDLGETLSKYYFENGLRTMRGKNVLPTLQCRILGGGTVFNSAINLRMPEWQVERWKHEYGAEGFEVDTMKPYFDWAEEFFEMRPTKEELFGERNRLFMKGASEMGFEPEPILRNTNGCKGSAMCLLGCNNAGKVSTDRKGIPEAVDNGARVYTCVVVEEVIRRGDRIAGVVGRVVDPVTGKRGHEVRITAKVTVMGAGTVATPVILKRSGLQHRNIGNNLRGHPGIIAMGRYEHDVNPWTGVTQGVQVKKFLEGGIKLESVWTSSALFASNFAGVGQKFQSTLADYRKFASWDAWVSGDDSIGRVNLLPGGRADIQFELGQGDVRRLQEGTAKLAEMFFASGALEVHTAFIEPFGVLYDAEDIERFRRHRFDVTELTSGSNHIFGTMAMGGDPDVHPCDLDGSVREVEDLYVVDSGVFPTTPGVNPMHTIFAVARKFSEQIADIYAD